MPQFTQHRKVPATLDLSRGGYLDLRSEAQDGYGFCMLLGYGSPNWQVSSSVLISDFNAAELETCQLGEPYLIGRGVNPTF